MIIDLDDFKEVNDTLGHHIGDSLLQQVAQRLTDTLRVDDTVARFGGDEFAVVARVRDRDDAEAIGRNVLASLHEPFVLQDLPFHIEASVGGAMYPEHARELDGLLQKADVAMYLVKERRSGYETYTASRDRSSPRRLALLGELRRAVEQDELVLHYQPIADLRTGNVVAMEALARWDHPEHGLLLPDEFIPLAEPTGLITIMTRRILSLAIAQCRQWRDAGLEPQIAVNISARNLHHDDLIAHISAILATHDVPPTALDLEITESAVIADPRRATEILSSLNEIGIETTLDDFGTGHSSLAQLKRLPVKRLKIDQSFVVNMSTDEEDAAIVSSIVELGQNLGLAVVAEGVESATVWAQLADLGCDFAQGYYLSRPLPPDQMTRWLEHYTPRQSSRPAADVDPQPAPISLVRTISA
jgi:diguanylate cyclase (GGDEF)-like protein